MYAPMLATEKPPYLSPPTNKAVINPLVPRNDRLMTLLNAFRWPRTLPLTFAECETKARDWSLMVRTLVICCDWELLGVKGVTWRLVVARSSTVHRSTTGLIHVKKVGESKPRDKRGSQTKSEIVTTATSVRMWRRMTSRPAFSREAS